MVTVTTSKTTFEVQALDGGKFPRERGYCYSGGYPNRDVAEKYARDLQRDGLPCEVVRKVVTTSTVFEPISSFDVAPRAG